MVVVKLNKDSQHRSLSSLAEREKEEEESNQNPGNAK